MCGLKQSMSNTFNTIIMTSLDTLHGIFEYSTFLSWSSAACGLDAGQNKNKRGLAQI